MQNTKLPPDTFFDEVGFDSPPVPLSKRDFVETTPHTPPSFSDSRAQEPTEAKFDVQVKSSAPEQPPQPDARLSDRRVGESIEREHRRVLELEDRRFRYWVMKIIIVCFCLITFTVSLTISYAFLFQHREMDNGVIKNFLETFTEILKILKPPNS